VVIPRVRPREPALAAKLRVARPAAATGRPPGRRPTARSSGADRRGRTRAHGAHHTHQRGLRTLPRQFRLLAAGTLVYLIGVEICYPFETIYLNRNLGVSMTTLGSILGITLFATLPMQVIGGALCDKVGRRPVLIVAILGSMTLYIGLGLTGDLWLVVALIAF